MTTYQLNFVTADKYGNVYQGPKHGAKNGADRVLLVGAVDMRDAKVTAREYFSMIPGKRGKMAYPHGVIAIIEGDISTWRPRMYSVKDSDLDTPRWTTISKQYWPADICITWFDGSVTDSLDDRPRRIPPNAMLDTTRSVLKINTSQKATRRVLRSAHVPEPNGTPDPSRMQRMPTEVYTVRYIACPNCHEAIQLPKES